MKKFIAGFLSCLMLTGVVYAAEKYVAERADFKVIVNNVERTEWYYIPPVVIEGRTMLPLKSIGDALGVDTSWDEETRSVYVGQRPLTNVYDNLELTIFNHGVYDPKTRQITVDIRLKNIGNEIINFKCTNFIHSGYVPVAFEADGVRGGLQDMHRLTVGTTFNIKLFYTFEDIGEIVLANQKPYIFNYDQIVNDKVSKRIEIKYYY